MEPRGQFITQADHQRIHLFVYEFTVRALLPWVEKTMRSLNDQVYICIIVLSQIVIFLTKF